MSDMERWSNLGGIEIPVNLLLLVEDDSETAALVKTALERHHVSVRVAKDGGQAQASFVMHKPDFVILDLILPGESGFEICERFKHADESIPVLIYTAIDMDDSRDLAQRVGADAYLVKPASAEQLVDTVREVAEMVWRRKHLEEPEAEPERVRFTCVCGKKFKVSSAHRGKSLTCPQCGEPLVVPKRPA